MICLAEEPANRPHMKDVVHFLEPAAAYKGDAGTLLLTWHCCCAELLGEAKGTLTGMTRGAPHCTGSSFAHCARQIWDMSQT